MINIYLSHEVDPMDTLSRLRSNINEGVLHGSKNPRSGASAPDAICIRHKIFFLESLIVLIIIMSLARISLTLSCHFSLSFIALGKSSGLHPVSSHSCCMYIRAGRPAFAWPYAWVHRSTSPMSSSLLLQQCPVCLVRLTCIVFVMGGK